jgi:hypothetical protein
MLLGIQCGIERVLDPSWSRASLLSRVCAVFFSLSVRVCCFFVNSALLVRDKMYLVSSVGWNGEVCICVSCNCVGSHRCSTTNIRHLPCECWRLRCSDVLSQLHLNNRVDERAMQYA